MRSTGFGMEVGHAYIATISPQHNRMIINSDGENDRVSRQK